MTSFKCFTKTTIHFLLLFVGITAILISCQKETSFERGNSTPSVGSLSVDASGNCLGAIISGNYYKDTAIKTSNYADVSGDVRGRCAVLDCVIIPERYLVKVIEIVGEISEYRPRR